jgi:hypothetical protein
MRLAEAETGRQSASGGNLLKFIARGSCIVRFACIIRAGFHGCRNCRTTSPTEPAYERFCGLFRITTLSESDAIAGFVSP